MKTNFTIATMATALLVAGCSTVKLKPGAEDVEVLSQARTAHCDRLGQTRVSIADKLGPIPRGDKAIRADLERLARNSAIGLGGDTLTPVSEVEDGEQVFAVYDCVAE